MPKQLEYPETHEQGFALGRNRWRHMLVDHPVSVVSGKDLHSQAAILSSANKVQDSWSQIMLHGVLESIEPESGSTCSKMSGESLLYSKALRESTKHLAEESHRQTVTCEVSSRGTECESFVRRSQRLDEQGRTDAALDLIYDSIDERLRNSQFPEIDTILAQLPTNELSTDILLGLLTATLPARRKLDARRTFYCEVENSLKQRGEYEDGLLTGLE